MVKHRSVRSASVEANVIGASHVIGVGLFTAYGYVTAYSFLPGVVRSSHPISLSTITYSDSVRSQLKLVTITSHFFHVDNEGWHSNQMTLCKVPISFLRLEFRFLKNSSSLSAGKKKDEMPSLLMTTSNQSLLTASLGCLQGDGIREA